MSGTVPRVGMLATVRNRRAIIRAVATQRAHTATMEELHLVTVEYTDSDGVAEETLLWEREVNAGLTEARALPVVERDAPMSGAHYDALVRSARWSALTPFLRPDGGVAEMPLASPFFGGVQVEDYQLVPLLKSLQMPRISLLIADDVGLGKTIEAGLILTELLIRRRVRRVLVLCPGSLQGQWQQELQDKFSLSFDVVDRAETLALQRRIGPDANPWRTCGRIVSSYHYLRQPDVREAFLATCRQGGALAGMASLPWDLLIVDEAHNCMPSNFGADSDLAETLRQISPWFEHRIFLTATPHNGHTRCFTGLLEMLDPVRFTQTDTLDGAQRHRVEDVLIRRLKREINEQDSAAGRTPRFPVRSVRPLPLYFRREEQAISRSFAALRSALRGALLAGTTQQRQAAGFAMEVLNKRLLSCSWTFADSWRRFREGMRAEESVDERAVRGARRAMEQESTDDREQTDRALHVARTAGLWLRAWAGVLSAQIAEMDAALAALGLAEEGALPRCDARFDRLVGLIRERLMQDGGWLQDERLVVFTEYKTTLDYLERRLRQIFPEPGRVRVMYGGMDGRDNVRIAFNEPADPVRVLLATDAASEGLNLQMTARLLLHYEVPWNPSRLEQRNGRIDRHGQARDVTVMHFTSEDDADLRFMAHVVRKVDEIREDLGAVGEVFDAAFERRFHELESSERVAEELDRSLSDRRPVDMPGAPAASAEAESDRLRETRAELDLSPESLLQTLGTAMGERVIEGPDGRGRYRLAGRLPAAWQGLIDACRVGKERTLPELIFDPALFVQQAGKRPVFRPERGTVLLHLGHPLMRQAIHAMAPARNPGEGRASRWVVRRGELAEGIDAVICLTVEELAVNALREAFHHTVRTIRWPVSGGVLGAPMRYAPPGEPLPEAVGEADLEEARAVWEDVRTEVQDGVRAHARRIGGEIRGSLEARAAAAIREAKEGFSHRISEVERALSASSLRQLKAEYGRAEDQLRQVPLLMTAQRQEQEEKVRAMEAELVRRRVRYDGLLTELRREQGRIVGALLPMRYRVRDEVQVFPVAVEIRLRSR